MTIMKNPESLSMVRIKPSLRNWKGGSNFNISSFPENKPILQQDVRSTVPVTRINVNQYLKFRGIKKSTSDRNIIIRNIKAFISFC